MGRNNDQEELQGEADRGAIHGCFLLSNVEDFIPFRGTPLLKLGVILSLYICDQRPPGMPREHCRHGLVCISFYYA